MDHPDVTCVVLHGQKIYCINTTRGMVHVAADRVYEHLSDVVRDLRAQQVVDPPGPGASLGQEPAPADALHTITIDETGAINSLTEPFPAQGQ